VSSALEKAGFNVALIEPGESGALNAQKCGLTTIICATADTAQIKNSSLPAIGLFDVIEHIEDDSRFLESMYSLLIEEGKLYATVPAYSFLWSDEDVGAGHYRRYTLDNITEKLQACGFEIEYSSYIFRMLPLPIFLVRRLPYLFGYRPKNQAGKNASKSHVVNQGVVSRLLDNILAAETRNIARKKTMSFGGSCLIVAKKP
jgi:hypothetical protein